MRNQFWRYWVCFSAFTMIRIWMNLRPKVNWTFFFINGYLIDNIQNKMDLVHLRRIYEVFPTLKIVKVIRRYYHFNTFHTAHTKRPNWIWLFTKSYRDSLFMIYGISQTTQLHTIVFRLCNRHRQFIIKIELPKENHREQKEVEELEENTISIDLLKWCIERFVALFRVSEFIRNRYWLWFLWWIVSVVCNFYLDKIHTIIIQNCFVKNI